MKNYTTEKCFLRNHDGSYTEITYSDLLRLKEMNFPFRSGFFLPLEGGLLEVPEDIYRHFKRAERRERYLWEEAERFGSMLSMDTGEQSLHDMLTDVAACAEHNIMLERLYEVSLLLPEHERALIFALYFEGKTEQQLANETGIPRKTINNHRRKILGKLHKLLKNQK